METLKIQVNEDETIEATFTDGVLVVTFGSRHLNQHHFLSKEHAYQLSDFINDHLWTEF